MSPREEILFEVRDRKGRRVVLTQRRWNHVLERHHDMVGLIPEVMRAVREPSHVLPGHSASREVLLLEGVGPSRWLFVVVQIDGPAGGRIITAFPRGKFPRRKKP